MSNVMENACCEIKTEFLNDKQHSILFVFYQQFIKTKERSSFYDRGRFCVVGNFFLLL